MREPLIAPLAAIALGILLARAVPFEPRELGALIAAFSALGALSLWLRKKVLALACTLLALTAAGCFTWLSHRPGPAPELDTDDGEPVILSGCVVDPAVLARDREQFTLELGPGARARVNWYLRPGETAPAFRYGQLVEFPAKTRRPHNYQNPGAFDYVHYLARQSIYWTASSPAGARAKILPGRCGSSFWRAIYALRTAALGRIETLYQGSPYNIAMMEAVLIGESSGLERIWTEEYRATGTFHALVISGSHVAVLAAFLLALLRLCFVPRDWATLATVLAAWLYAFITGWQAPVIRSAAGMTLFAIGRMFYREGRLLNVLAAVALVFLLADPEQMFDPSFQLSFLSVALIGAFVVPIIEKTSGPLSRGLPALRDAGRDVYLPPETAQFRIEMRMGIRTLTLLGVHPAVAHFALSAAARIAIFFYDLILTSAMIQIGLALPMAIYFHRVSFSGLSANAVVVPLLGAVVPIGFLALFTNSTFLAGFAAWLLDLSRITVGWHSRWEPNWRIPDPPIWLALAFPCALILAAIRFRRLWPRLLAGAAALILLAVLVRSPFPPIVQPGALEVTAIDVGQGDSILVAFPDGKVMLIDGGGIPGFGRKYRTRLDVGEDVVAPYLWTRAIRRIDVVALTHAHEDHIGGLPAILRDFEVGEVWTGAIPEGFPLPFLQVRRMQAGEPFAFGGASVQILAPLPDYEPGAAPKNNDSLVMRIVYGRRSVLLTGDMEKQIEARLTVPRTDVLKVGHHGSHSSSMPAFLDAVHPAFALISVGFENSYGHPHRDTLDHLAERRILTLRTDRQGLLTIRTNGWGRWSVCATCPRSFSSLNCGILPLR